LNCKPRYWSNWELDPENPTPVTYAPNVYKKFGNPSAGIGGTTDCTCPDGQKFATAVKKQRNCDSIDTHCKYGTVPKSNDCQDSTEGPWSGNSVICGKKLEFTTDPYKIKCTSDNCRTYNDDNDELATQCSSCWTEAEMTDYDKWPGKGSYKYWEVVGRDKTEPWVLDPTTKKCLLKCDTGYWSNYGISNRIPGSTMNP
jgi:hypothetical protein